MSTIQHEFNELFQRDLDRLIDNLKETPDDKLWEVPQQVSNSCGVLAQHLVGNLNHFIGKGLGDLDYIRQREVEFSNTETSKEELIEDIQELKERLDNTIPEIDDEMLNKEYPLKISYDVSARQFLAHLYGHLNYHLGQINYLRRML